MTIHYKGRDMGKLSLPIILAGIGVLIFGILVSSYNGLFSSREEVDQKWAVVETDYQRRADLIPNLVKTVEGVAEFEQETLENVINARSKATSITVDPSNPDDIAAFQAAQGEVSSALGRLLAVVEDYPDLKAVEAFRDLQVQLEGTENRIAVSRKDYTEAVKDYNVRRGRFPTVMVANLFGFDARAQFESDEGADQAPEVEFDFGNDGQAEPATN